MQDSAGESLETRQELLLTALQDSGRFTKGISDASHAAYLEEITEYGLAADDSLIAQESIRVKTENINKASNNATAESVRFLDTLSGSNSDDQNADLATFTSAQAALDGEQKMTTRIPDYIQSAGEDLYQKTMALGGTKKEASMKVANWVQHLSKKFNRPEFIEHGLNIKLGDGLKLKDVHGTELNNTQDQVSSAKAKQLRNLENAAIHQKAVRNKAIHDTTYVEAEALMSNVLANPADDDAATEFIRYTDDAITELEKKATAGEYDDNLPAYIKLRTLHQYNKALVGVKVGDPLVEAEAERLMDSEAEDLTADWVIHNKAMLGPDSLGKIKNYLDDSMKADTLAAGLQVQAAKARRARRNEAPVRRKVADYQSLLQGEELEIAQRNGSIGALVTGSAVHKAGMDSVHIAADAKGSKLNDAEYSEAYTKGSQPLVDLMEEQKKIMGKSKEELRKKAEGKTESEVEVDKFHKIITNDKHPLSERLVAQAKSLEAQPDLAMDAGIREFMINFPDYDPTEKTSRDSLKQVLLDANPPTLLQQLSLMSPIPMSLGPAELIAATDFNDDKSIRKLLKNLSDDKVGDRDEAFSMMTGKEKVSVGKKFEQPVNTFIGDTMEEISTQAGKTRLGDVGRAIKSLGGDYKKNFQNNLTKVITTIIDDPIQGIVDKQINPTAEDNKLKNSLTLRPGVQAAIKDLLETHESLTDKMAEAFAGSMLELQEFVKKPKNK